MDFALVGFVVLIVMLVVTGFLVKRFVIEPAKKTTTYRISERFGNQPPVREQKFSRLIGLESVGLPESIIIGTLATSAERLGFAPTNEGEQSVDVAISDVIEVELATSHLGLSTGMPLLKVRFRTPDGEDSAAFHLPYTDEWYLTLTNLTQAA